MITILSFIVLLAIVVAVHEGGHFMVARRNGVRVEKFSVGFGPKLFSKKVGDTEYVISAIPLGGYVKMAGENQDEIKNLPDEFASKTLWQRGKIVFAGPAINILLAFLLMPLVYLVGTKEPVYLTQPAKVGWVENDSPAQKAGMKDGDLITQVGDIPIDNWKQLRALVGKTFTSLKIKRGDQLVDLSTSGDLTGIFPDLRPEVQKVISGKPAALAGLKEEDVLLSVDGKPIAGLNHFFYLLIGKAGETVKLDILRQGIPMTVSVIPVYDEKAKRVIIGIAMGAESHFVRYGLFEAVHTGSGSLIDSISMTFLVLGKLVTGKLSMDVMGGPIHIAQMSGQAAKSGLGAFISLMAMISLQLGIFNLLPIPVLDGGWIVLFGIEGILGHPLSKKMINTAQFMGLTLLVGLMVYVTINDIWKIFK
jgi:regulator of sigma E protease